MIFPSCSFQVPSMPAVSPAKLTLHALPSFKTSLMPCANSIDVEMASFANFFAPSTFSVIFESMSWSTIVVTRLTEAAVFVTEETSLPITFAVVQVPVMEVESALFSFLQLERGNVAKNNAAHAMRFNFASFIVKERFKLSYSAGPVPEPYRVRVFKKRTKAMTGCFL